MNERDWNECLEENSALRVSKNPEKSKSLIKVAEGRIIFLEKQKINEENANYIFEGFYTSLLEIIHFLILREGFKVNNHLCLGYFLRDKLGREDLFRVFDDLRYKRNSLVYYGSKLDFEIAKDSINKIKNLIEKTKIIGDKING